MRFDLSARVLCKIFSTIGSYHLFGYMYICRNVLVNNVVGVRHFLRINNKKIIK